MGKSLVDKFEPKYEKVSFSGNSLEYSPIELRSYEPTRHVEFNELKALLGKQDNLPLEKLDHAIKEGKIRIYNFNENQYFDRLDVGRIYAKFPENSQGLEVNRYFTEEGKDPFESVAYEKRDLLINSFDENGNINGTVFDLKGAEIPVWMDNPSANIVGQKYFFNPSKDEWKQKLKEKIGTERETSVKQVNLRVADFFADEGYKLGYFQTEEDKNNFRDELLFIQANGFGAFNSPTQFNAGLFNSYGIAGSSGINYYRDPKTGEVSRVLNGEYIHPQLHACFIRGPTDDLESLAQQVVDEIGIFSSGSGSGHNCDNIRAEGENLSGGGKASGPLSFEKIYDRVAGSIKSGGKTRRAARKVDIGYRHPDSMEFIRAKVREDLKAKTLMEEGFSPEMDGEAYTTVSFQNTNLSVRLDDEFFETLENGGEIEFYNVNDGQFSGKMSADRMLKEIAFGTWRIGDPAVQYEGMIQKMNTVKNSGKQKATNPCGEFSFLNNSSCSLFSARLTAFLNKDGTINIPSFKNTFRILTIAQNIANHAASYPVKEIAKISPEFETIGAGYADLGALLIREGLPYNSTEGRALTGALTALMTGTVYEVSSEIAEAKGTFAHYEFNKDSMLDVLKEHKKNLTKIDWTKIQDEKLKSAVYESWKNVMNKGKEVGFSNAQATVLAPTGTISYLMGCSTQGIEPAMSLSIKKNLAGGGEVTLVNKDTEIGLKKLRYSDEQIKDVATYLGDRNTMVNAPHVKPEHYKIFDTSFGNAEGEGSIPLDGHLRIMSAAQPFISGAISKTINLPESATVKDIYDCYREGHKLELKGITAFRNNSKPISALSLGKKSFKKLNRGEKEDLPSTREAHEWELEIGGTPFHIIASEYEDGRPGQITFLSYKTGSTLNSLFATSGIIASKALKRGVHLRDVTSGWEGQNFEPNGLVRGHDYIKIASSPLDLAHKLLALEYLGEKDLANDPKLVNLTKLRGFKNGAFNTYQSREIDDWDADQVLNDPVLGGFKEGKRKGNGRSKVTRGARGRTCSKCGAIMVQDSSNCFHCSNCGDKSGGCGG